MKKDDDPANADLAAYLRRATRGLKSRKRQEITSELIGHLEARVQEFKLAGVDAAALRQTLRELGEPDYVHSGMQRVYLRPSLLRTTGLLGALACGAVFIACPLRNPPRNSGPSHITLL